MFVLSLFAVLATEIGIAGDYLFVPTNAYLQDKKGISHLLRWELVV